MRLERDENSNQRLQWKCLRHGERSEASVKVLRTVKVAAQRLRGQPVAVTLTITLTLTASGMNALVSHRKRRKHRIIITYKINNALWSWIHRPTRYESIGVSFSRTRIARIARILHDATPVRASGMNASELTPFKFGFTCCKFTIIAFYFTRLHGLSELIFIFAIYECR